MFRRARSWTARTLRWDRSPVSEVLLSFALFFMCLVGYNQLAVVRWEVITHSLPADSRALAGYPCDGGTARVLTYVILNAPSVIWDYCHVHTADAWMLPLAAGLLVRLVGSMVLAPGMYSKVVAPAVMYSLRGLLPAFLLAKGPDFQPSQYTLRCLFRTYAAFDMGYFCSMLGVWHVNTPLELVFCCFTAVSLWVLCYWYRDIVPGGVNLPLQIATRLLVPVLTLSIARAAQRGQQYDNSGGGHHVGSSGSSSSSPARAVEARQQAMDAGVEGHDPDVRNRQTAASGLLSDGDDGDTRASSGVDGSTGTPGRQRPTCQEALTPASASRTVTPKEQGISRLTSMQTAGYLAPSSPQAATSAGADTSGPAVDLSPPPPPALPSMSATVPDAAASAVATNPNNQAKRRAVTTEGAAPPPPQPPGLSYQSFFRTRMACVKIPWAEPEQLTPDFRQRLRQLVEEKGEGRWRLEGVFVRRGCVELSLVLSRRRAPPGSDAAPDPQPPDVSLEASELMWALGLEPPPPPLAAKMESGAGGRTAGGIDDDSGAGGGGGGCAGPSASPRRRGRRPAARMWVLLGDEATVGAPRVLSAWPRVVLLPSDTVSGSPPPAASSSTSPTRFPADLRVVVAWGVGDTAPGSSGAAGPSTSSAPSVASGREPGEGVGTREDVTGAGPLVPGGTGPWEEEEAPPEGPVGNPRVQVLVRACNEYLPAQFTSSNAVPGSGDLPSYKYDIELRDPPPRPGVLLVELSGGPAGAEDSGGGGGGHAAGHCQRVSIPLLATYDPGVASELTAAVADWPHGARPQLDALLYDVGVWMAARDGVDVTGPDPLHIQLGCHLLRYAEAAGFEHTAALLRTGGGGGGGHAGGSMPESTFSASAVVPAVTVAVDRASTATTDVSSKGEQHPAAPSSAGDEGSGSRALPLSSSSPAGPVMTPVEKWSVDMAETLHVVETALFVILLLRNHHAGVPLLSSINGLLTMCMGISAVSLLARLLLPYATWARFAVHARVPRYLGYIFSKALVAVGLAPPPSGVVPYTTGPGMVLQEGLILPGCCLLDLRTAALFAALKTLANAGIMMMSGAATGLVSALLVSARTEALALLTTTACHVYLKTARADAWTGCHGAAGRRSSIGATRGGRSPALAQQR